MGSPSAADGFSKRAGRRDQVDQGLIWVDADGAVPRGTLGFVPKPKGCRNTTKPAPPSGDLRFLHENMRGAMVGNR